MNLKILLMGAIIGIVTKEIISLIIYEINNENYEIGFILNYPLGYVFNLIFLTIYEFQKNIKNYPQYYSFKRDFLKQIKNPNFDLEKWNAEKENIEPKTFNYIRHQHFYREYEDSLDEEE